MGTWWNPAVAILVVGIMIVSCDLMITDEDSDNKSGSVDQGQVGQYPSTHNYINPVVTVTDSTEFTVTDGGLVRSSSTSTYMYGVLFVEYSGSESVCFVRATLKYMDSNGDVLYTDSTYVTNDGFALLNSVATDTYVSPAHNTAVINLIDDLSDYSIDLTNISMIDVKFTHSDSGVDSIVDAPLIKDSVVEVSGSEWYLPVTNTYGSPVYVSSGIGWFNDSTGRLGYWAYGSLHELDGSSWSYNDSIIDNGQSARVVFHKNTPDYLSADLSLQSVILGCDLPDSASTSVLFPSSYRMNALSVDEMNAALSRARIEHAWTLEQTVDRK